MHLVFYKKKKNLDFNDKNENKQVISISCSKICNVLKLKKKTQLAFFFFKSKFAAG